MKYISRKNKKESSKAQATTTPPPTQNRRGPPTDYDDSMPDKLLDFFSVEPFRVEMKKIVTKSGDVIEVPTEVASVMPTRAGFAILVGVNRGTLRDWAKRHKEFGHAYSMAKEYQERFCVVNGMRGLIDKTLAIFTLKNVAGWRDAGPEDDDSDDESSKGQGAVEELKKLLNAAINERKG